MDRAELLDRWRRELAGWAIPEHITAQVSESPWILPRPVFARRAARQQRSPSGPSFDRAWEALEEPGSVLDVGAGAGAACLPLAERATAITAVDTDADLLDAFTDAAARLTVPTRTILGRWPDVAGTVPAADVVTCHHVLYNVGDLEPFVAALTDHARRRVVVELTARHPLAGLNPLWERFHGLRRPEAPIADDALAILDALGFGARVEAWSRPAETDHDSFEDLVDVTRRRLCLPMDRIAEVAAALRDLGVDPGPPPRLEGLPRELVTVWWPGTAH